MSKVKTSRKNFLKLLGAGGLVFSLSSILHPALAEDMMMIDSNGPNIVKDIGNPFMYTIYIDPIDNKYKARNNMTGITDYVSEGTTDATSVITSAATAASATGSSIFIKAGTYNCGSQLDFSGKNIKIQGDRIGSTILHKNYVDATNGFIKSNNQPPYSYVSQEYAYLSLKGDGAGIGYDGDLNEQRYEFMRHVGMENFGTGIRLKNSSQLNFFGCVIQYCGIGLSAEGTFVSQGPTLIEHNNTLQFFGGAIQWCNQNVWLQANNDSKFYGVSLEHPTINSVRIDSPSCNNCFDGCSFEVSGATTNTEIIVDGGVNNSFTKNRFSSELPYKIYHATHTNRGGIFAFNLIDANAAAGNPIIQLDPGVTNVKLIGNLKTNSFGITLTFIDNTDPTSNLECYSNTPEIPNIMRPAVIQTANASSGTQLDIQPTLTTVADNTTRSDLRLHNVKDFINDEWLEIGAYGTDAYRVEMLKAGTGNLRSLVFRGDGTDVFRIETSGVASILSCMDFNKITLPANPPANMGRMYVKQIDTNNDGLFILLKKAGVYREVQIS